MGNSLSKAVNERLEEIDLDQQSTISVSDARLLFAKFDTDHNGILDRKEGEKFLSAYLSVKNRNDVNDEKIDSLFKKLDINGGKYKIIEIIIYNEYYRR
jgi:hypothetical protein